MKIEEAIHIMEPGTEPTDEQLAKLQTDTDLREVCQDIMILQGVLAEENVSTHPIQPHLQRGKVSFFKKIGIGLAVAAVFAGVFFLLHLNGPEQEESEPPVSLLSGGITITTSDGKSQVLDLKKDDNGADAIYTVPVPHKESSTSLKKSDKQTTETKVTIPYGHSLQIVLNDGTRVYMHPGSRIVYPEPFVGAERSVKLSGEAYFCVASDPARPFVVHTDHGDVRDYGTEFNVCAESDNTEVVLIEGSVGVTPTASKEHLMQPGQMATFNNGQTTPTIQIIDSDRYTAWRDGYFYFNEETLGDIITQLACYYNLSVECHQPDLLHLRLRYIIPRNSTEAYAVEILNRLQRGHISLEGSRIVVK